MNNKYLEEQQLSPEEELTFHDQKFYSPRMVLDRSKYPEVYDINVGLEAAEFLNLGEFKYDEEATSLSQLEDLNQFRKDSIYFHASDTSEIVFWIFLIGLPLLRYIILLIRWLSKSSPNNS